MLKPKFFALSCYKLMVLLGIMDIISIWISSIFSGYFMILGASYCTHPNIAYIAGGLGTGEY